MVQRYLTLFVAASIVFAMFVTWRRFEGAGRRAAVDAPKEEKREPPAESKTEEKNATEKEILALPETPESSAEEGFIPVPDDGTVPEGSSIRLDLSSGKRTYKPPTGQPKVIDDVHDHRDFVDMAALADLHQKMAQSPKEPTKWRKQFLGVQKGVEDLLKTLSPQMSTEAALKAVEELEDCCISSGSNSGGIFHSDYFMNLVYLLQHGDPKVRAAAASMMFYAVQNNFVPSEALLANSPALKIISRALSTDKDPSVLYKCISIVEASLAVCAESERFKLFAANLKQADMFARLVDSLPLTVNASAPEKVATVLTLVAQMTEDESCMVLLEKIASTEKLLPKSLLRKIATPVCPLTHKQRQPILHNLCRTL